MDENNVPSLKFTKNIMVRAISRNAGGIVMAQIQIFVDNLIYREYIVETPDNGLKLTDKVFKDLRDLDKIIHSEVSER